MVTSRGAVVADISYGGATYASVSAPALGLAVIPEHYADLIAAGREVKHALETTEWAQHPSDPRLDDAETGPQQRNVTVFAAGEVDRSPCGSGTSARLALLADEGRIAAGQTLVHHSIVGTTFLGQVVDNVIAEGRTAVMTQIQGSAYRTGQAVFSLDPRDPLGTGFVLR